MIKVIDWPSNPFWFLAKLSIYKAIFCWQWHWDLVGNCIKALMNLSKINLFTEENWFFSVPIYNVHIRLYNIIIYILCFFNNKTILSSLYKSSKALFFISLWHWIVQVLSETFIVELEVLTLHQESLQYTHIF